ncbi:GILT-like protein 1 [Cochliomyia hominivorax]
MFKQINSLLPVILVIFAFSICNGQISGEKLKVLVLYESLCPDSIRFMGRQLGPSYEELKDYIDISLVPFGKSQSKNNGGQFFCQHGPRECLGNRQQSCVLQQTKDQLTQVKFAVCQMTIPDNSNIQYCAESVSLSSDIDTCMNTELGTLLQLEAERITHSYAISFVPTIIYDGVFDQQLQDNSLRDFRGTVCGLLQKRGQISFHDAVCQ